MSRENRYEDGAVPLSLEWVVAPPDILHKPPAWLKVWVYFLSEVVKNNGMYGRCDAVVRPGYLPDVSQSQWRGTISWLRSAGLIHTKGRGKQMSVYIDCGDALLLGGLPLDPDYTYGLRASCHGCPGAAHIDHDSGTSAKDSVDAD